MKVLYLAHNLQNTGWGRAARENILALDAAGVDVVWRPIRLSGDDYEPKGQYLELYEKDIHDSDIVIQHVLPQYLSYNGNFKKNIAYFVAETQQWNYSGFHHNINLMDELWCPNVEMGNDAISFINIPVRLVPHPTDIEKYTKEYKKIDAPHISSGYNFYTICDYNKRKRIGLAIQAFNLEFKKTEPVNLIIKVYKKGRNPDDLSNEINTLAEEIKSGLKLYTNNNLYPKETIVSSFMSEEDIMALHYNAQCYVNTSFGDAWNYPAFDAMAMGNGVISSNCGGPSDFLECYDNAYFVDGEYKPVFGMHKENFSNYNSSKEAWFDADIYSLMARMRECYENDIGRIKSKNRLTEAKKCSRERVGKLMKGLLE